MYIPEYDAKAVKIVECQYNFAKVEPCSMLGKLALLSLHNTYVHKTWNKSSSQKMEEHPSGGKFEHIEEIVVILKGVLYKVQNVQEEGKKRHIYTVP